MNATAQPQDPNRGTSTAKEAITFAVVEKQSGRVSEYFVTNSAVDQTRRATEPQNSSYNSSWDAPSPMDPIIFDGKTDAGWNTFEGFNTPRYSGMKIDGNRTDVRDNERVVILVIPAITKTNMYTILSALIVWVSRSREAWDDFAREPDNLAKRKEKACCKISTHIGKTCQAAIQFCFWSYVRMDGAGRARAIAGKINPIASEIGMLNKLGIVTAKSLILREETVGEVERWIAR